MDGGYGEILDQTLLEGCQHKADPSVLGFFRAPRDGERPKRPQSFHRWVSSPFGEAASDEDVRATAKEVAEELLATPAQLMRELLVGEPSMLPVPPKWADEAPLHDAFNGRTGRHRFNVVGGNRLYATGDVTRDLKRAYARLIMLNIRRPFSRSEPLRVYCAGDHVPYFETAMPTVRFAYSVTPQPELKADEPWALTRDRAIAVVRVEKPTVEPPAFSGVMFGAKFEVWLADPMSAVRVEREPN